MENDKLLRVNEIFYSIQGESTFAGLRCIFIRLTGCDIGCDWCDTKYAYKEGTEMTVDEIVSAIRMWDCKLVEVTGGEPLLQPNSIELMQRLIIKGYKVLLETSGVVSISKVPSEVTIIMDIKCPSSGVSDKNCYDNIGLLKVNDEMKFVIANRKDYEFAKEKVKEIRENGCGSKILFSSVRGRLDLKQLAKWILDDNLAVRLQLQLHKYIDMK